MAPAAGIPLMDLKAKLLDPQRTVLLYGTTPPRAGSSEAAIDSAAEKLAARIRKLPLDAIVVYDIQDESGRTHIPRPFAFTGTTDPRTYSRLLGRLAERPPITYKCVGDVSEPEWRAWLDETGRDYGLSCLSIVGRPTSGVRHPVKLSRAIGMAVAHAHGFTVGAVVIAERHDIRRSEAARMLAKSMEGCSYFISQTVYHAGQSIRLLRDYLRDCRGAGVDPRRVVLSFAPCGRERTMAFIRWLGVKVPTKTERAILSAPNPIGKSIDICRDNLRGILDHDYFNHIPLGINVESVSINRDEIDASVDLFHVLAEEFENRRR
ncbi:MAG: hypothetical protein ACT4NU_01380 [Chromatiales bacterium]